MTGRYTQQDIDNALRVDGLSPKRIEALEAWQGLYEQNGVEPSIREIGRHLDRDHGNVGRDIRDAVELGDKLDSGKPHLQHPELPSSSREPEEIIGAAKKHFTRLQTAKDARRWRKIRLRGAGPMGVVFFGDPHTDNPGCDWIKLERDIKLVKETEGMFCANAGDSVDNWVGRLIKYHGKAFVTVKEAWQLAEWFLKELEDKWVAWVIGNHDSWNDGMHIFDRMGNRKVEMDDWNARIVLKFDNGRECPIHLAHDFAGHSQYNPLHGMKKADLWNAGVAQVYLGGHKHTTALYREPCPNRGKPIIFGRAMGYKAIDGYGDMLGYSRQNEGESIALIFDQDAPTESKFIQAFTDIEEAVDYLKYKRSKLGV